MSLYKEPLSKKFEQDSHLDTEGYPFGFDHGKLDTPEEILYIIGCSWLQDTLVHRVLLNQHNKKLPINRAVPGNSNSLLIETLERDLSILEKLKVPTKFIVCFTEVGRSANDLKIVSPKNFSSTHDYFENILHQQYRYVESLLRGKKSFISCSFIPNTFNNNKTILDYCQPTIPRPGNAFTVYSNGIIDYLKHRKQIFQFEFISDLEKCTKWKTYIRTHEFVDDTLHPTHYKPYEDIFHNCILHLQ